MRKGQHMPQEQRVKIGLAQRGKPRPQTTGKKHGRWKSNNILSISQLHRRIRMVLPVPRLCPLCLLESPKQLSNKTGIYDLNIVNWWYLCIKCHIYYDGTINNLVHHGPDFVDMTGWKCTICGTDKTYIRTISGRPEWRYDNNGKRICSRCSDKSYNKLRPSRHLNPHREHSRCIS